jgi:hypothetical protein
MDKAEPMSVLEAATDGTRLDELKALRRVIAGAIDDKTTQARDLSSLARRQIEISREIEKVEEAEKQERHSARGHEADEPFDPATV